MEGQAGQSPAVLGAAAQLISPLPEPFQPPGTPPGGFLLSGASPGASAPVGRLLLATMVFAGLYTLLVPGALFVITALFAWELLRWLLFTVVLVPVLFGLGLLGLLKGVVPAGLLIGAVAARWPERVAPKLLVAFLLPLVDLLLLRMALLPHLLERGLLLVMDHRALWALDTMAPLAASTLAALLVPRRLLRALLGRSRSR